ncbi:hypothetical protein M2347_003931 [Chryseobacterium sp. H1D6B]|uniref:hypothetical protein n=1 Tax=Chryseobacterium sp. H1D6B TaxID=2940588 RepID=UPI0015CC4F02|nr:hypothetical protein [Chryseobacterium sp. H1D6B]MDH6254204.1 hypothetical protein [Chryseobacterium sp. H1D6B]
MKKLTVKLLFLLLVFCSFCLKSQTSNSKMENDWIIFVKNSDFSESFKLELSKQLEGKLYKLNNLDKDQKNPIKLVIGMEELNQTISNGYIFSSANVYINENDEMFPITICWKSSDFTDLKEIQKSNIIGKKINFEWCKDFPFQELKTALTTQKVYEKINNLNYIIKIKYYPDLFVNFNLNIPLNDKESEIIENIFNKNKKVYVSKFTENSIMLDFQIDSMNLKEEDFYKDIEFLKSSIKEISELEFSNKIENIEIK